MFGTKTSAKPSFRTAEGSRNNLPYAHIAARAVDPDTKVLFLEESGERYLGACYVSAPLAGADDGTIDKFKAALSIAFPAGTFIQIALLSTPTVEDFLQNYIGPKACKDEVLAALALQHTAHMRAGIEAPLVSRSGVLLNYQQVVVTVKTPLTRRIPDGDDIARAKEIQDQTEEGLKAAGLHTYKLDEKGYLKLLRTLYRLWDPVSHHFDEDKPLNEQVLSVGDAVNYDDPRTIAFHDGEHFAKVLSVKHFPKKTNLAVMNYLIGDPRGLSNQVTDPYYLVLTLHYPDQVKKKDWVKGRSAVLNHQTFGPMAKLIPSLGYKKEGMDVLVDEMDGKGAVICEANLTMFLFSKSKERLNRLSAGLLAYYTSIGFEMREDRRILEALWNNLLPLNTSLVGIDKLFRFHTLGVKHAVQFLPVIGEWTGTHESSSLLLLTRRGQPALFDLYSSTANYNGIVFAQAGAGKSYLTQKIISDYLAEGAKVWVIDAGLSYYKLCKAVGGSFIDFDPQQDLCLGLFTHVQDIHEEMDILKVIIAKMAAPEETLGAYEMSRLEEAIQSTFARLGTGATIRDVYQFLLEQSDEAIKRLGKQLYSFAEGSNARWFNGANNVDMDRSLVVLELSKLKGRKALQQAVLLQLMSRINHEMFLTRGRKKILVIDEAWELLDDPMMAKAMEALYRKVRKEKGSVIIVTQGINDLYNSANGEAIAANSAWQFILSQTSEAIDSAIKGGRFKIDPYGADVLRTVHTIPGKYSEVMIKRSDNEWGVFRLVTSRFSQVLFSTKDDERDLIFDAMESGMNVVDAVNNYIASEAGNHQTYADTAIAA